jgi:hypothetical protein
MAINGTSIPGNPFMKKENYIRHTTHTPSIKFAESASVCR